MKEEKGSQPLLNASAGEIIDALDIKDWDVLMIGDGSGQSWDIGAGWAVVLHEHYSNLRKTLWGGWSSGTNNIAELMAFVQGIFWYVRGPGKQRLKEVMHASPGGRVQIHAVTDSEVTATQGSMEKEQRARRENGPLWGIIDVVESQGYKVHWHHVKRSQIALNKVTDHISRVTRLTVTDVAKVAANEINKSPFPEGASAYDYNNGLSGPESSS